MVALNCGGRLLDLRRPQVMGILNLTPDSFSDGGHFVDVDRALQHAHTMVQEGASIIDVGAESTRPGAATVAPEEELQRLLPVLRRLRQETDVVISVDTSTAAVMREAQALGVGLINDVRALTKPGALFAARDSGLPICLMHMQGEPATMQSSPCYQEVVTDVCAYLGERMDICEQAGIERSRLLIDPGFGFGKTLAHNLALLRELAALKALNCPVLVGMSRKSMLGAVLGGAPVDKRLFVGLAAAVLAVERGASIIRTHDVGPTVEALRLVSALEGER